MHRAVGPVAYDCVKVIVVRGGSAILLSEFGQQPVKPGDVILLGANTLCGSEPEGHITVTTIYADTDYVVDQVFWQHVGLLQDRLDAQDFAATVYTEPAQILRLGEDRAGSLMPWLDERVRKTAEFDRLHATARQERNAYTAERDALRDERTKLLQAHYAGAVPLDLLASEQDRIARRLAFLDAQINAGDIEYDRARAHLDDCLALAGDCHAIYMSIDDSLRRLANQAFFDKLIVTGEDTIDGQPGEPFNILFDPGVQRIALDRQRQAESGRQTGNVVGLNNDVMVETRGFEPLTPALQRRCSTS